MGQREALLGLISALENVAADSYTVAACAAAVDRSDIQKRFQEVREYASQQSRLLYAVLGAPQQEKTDE